ncbi:MAG: hypothetical protein OHK0038_18930 [Flammeovirgaceae bacterium]
MKNINKIIEFIIFPLLLSIFCFTLYENIQPHFNYVFPCKLCDAEKYKAIFENFVNNTYNAVYYPFHTRIITPFIASVISPRDIIAGFHTTNFIFYILSSLTLYYIWREKLKINFILSTIGLLWLSFHWSGIPRLYNLYIINVDTGAYFFESICILLIISRKFNWFLIIAPLASFQKESFIPILIIIILYYLLSVFFLERKYLKVLLISLLLVLILKYFVNIIYPPIQSHSTLFTLYYNTLMVVDEPEVLIKIIVCFFTVFGAFVLVLIFKIKIDDFNSEIKAICFFISLLHIIFCIIGGRDLTRIIFIGFPFVMTLALLKLQECKSITIVTSILLSLPLLRISVAVPDQTKPELFYKWYLEVSSFEYVASWGVYAIFCYIILYHLENNNFKIDTNKKLII